MFCLVIPRKSRTARASVTTARMTSKIDRWTAWKMNPSTASTNRMMAMILRGRAGVRCVESN